MEVDRGDDTFSEVSKYKVKNTTTTSLNPNFEDMKIIINDLKETEMEFEIVGITAAVANTLRRCMMEIVPTVTIDEVTVDANTGVLQSENLAHRLGLIPLNVDPTSLPNGSKLVFTLNVIATTPNQSLHSSDLVWTPQSTEEAEKYAHCPPAPVDKGILITKLTPPDQIRATCYAVKGVGTTHAKFSPVSPAFYRMHPSVRFLDANSKPTTFMGNEAKELVSRCPGKVFDIEDGIAVVKRPRDCTMCRECVREDEWGPRIRLGVKKDHFIFSVESTGVLRPEVIVKTALQAFREKLRKLHKAAGGNTSPASG